MTDRIIIGQRIAELRKNKGLTQAELADRIGVSHQAVSQWERSETLPDILTLPALAEIFGESVSAIMGMEDVKAKDNAENVISDEDKDEEAAENAEEAPAEEAKDSGEPEITAEYTERSAEDDSGNVNIDGDGEKLDLKKDEYEERRARHIIHRQSRQVHDSCYQRRRLLAQLQARRNSRRKRTRQRYIWLRHDDRRLCRRRRKIRL